MKTNVDAGEGTKKRFGVPNNHTLIQTSYKVAGFRDAYESWYYNEYDENGSCVGSYREWDNMGPDEKPDSGWEKIS